MTSNKAEAISVLDYDVIIEDTRWPNLEEAISKCFTSVTNANVEGIWGGEVALVLTNNLSIHTLNHDFRGRNKPTNVLSFSAEPVPGLPPEVANNHVGDIVLAYETCVQEAKDKAIPLQDHAAHLIIHGCLHLFGYDHQNETEAQVMEGIEVMLLATLNIANPYETDEPNEERPL